MSEPPATRTRLAHTARRYLAPALGCLVVWQAAFWGFRTGALRRFEARASDLRFAVQTQRPHADAICRVDIDDQTFRAVGRWPMPRTEYARAIRALEPFEPKAILLDITFRNRGPVMLEDPAAFADTALQAADALGRVIESLNQRIEDGAGYDAALAAQWRASLGELLGFFTVRMRRFVDPDALFAEALAASPSTLLPYSFIESPLGLRRRPWFAEAAQRIGERPGMSPSELIAALGAIGDDEARFIDERFTAIRNEALVAWLADQAEDNTGGLYALKHGFRNSAHLSESERLLLELAAERLAARVRTVEAGSKAMSGGVPRPAWQFDTIDPPIAPLADALRQTGYVSTEPDALDGVFRSVPLTRIDGDRLFWHAGLHAVCRYLGADPAALAPPRGGWLTLPPGESASKAPVAIPVDGEGRMVINWSRAEWPDAFRGFSFAALRELDIRAQAALAELLALDVRYSRPPRIGPLIERLDAPSLGPGERDELQRQLDAETAALLSRLRGNIEAGRALVDEGRASENAMRQLDELAAQVGRYTAEAERRDVLARRIEDDVRGRIVLIGHTMTGSTDLKPTPVHALYPGVGVIAGAIDTILTGRWKRYTPAAADLALVLLVAAGTVALSLWLNLKRAAAAALLLAALYLGASQWAFEQGWITPAVAPMMAVALCFAGTAAWRELTEERAKRQVRRAFTHYVAPAVVDEIMKDPDRLAAGGRRAELSVFFADIVGFTAISERIEPNQLDRLVRRAHSIVCDAVLEHGGTHDKFVGDMVMAFFGAPLPQSNHALRACRAALDAEARLSSWSRQLQAEGLPDVRMRIGINSGEMIVGNMGSDTLFDFTVLGDAVNTGSRIQDSARLFGIDTLIGEATQRLVEPELATCDLGLIWVKNKRLPIRVYQLVGRKDALDDATRCQTEAFAEALSAYRARHWDDAIARFATLPTPPAQAYAQAAARCKATPPNDEWRGTLNTQ